LPHGNAAFGERRLPELPPLSRLDFFLGCVRRLKIIFLKIGGQ
jgi:hypothetical protein